jgi:hypothetical protein
MGKCEEGLFYKADFQNIQSSLSEIKKELGFKENYSKKHWEIIEAAIRVFSEKGFTTITKILNTIYENDFLDCSFGFRPNRNCHDALKIVPLRETGRWELIL